MANLDLGVIGNGTFGALLDSSARVVWCCLPRFDGDPVFYDLLNGGPQPNGDGKRGYWEVELIGQESSRQRYRENTAILETELSDAEGNAIQIVDFAPRFENMSRMFRPMMIVRRIRVLSGSPRIRIKLRPGFGYGEIKPNITRGSNHIRFVHDGLALRLSTNAPVQYVIDETPFIVGEPISFLLGPDEPLTSAIEHTARDFEEKTETYWRTWVRRLALPVEWQEAVIRAAITLKLCAYEETGAIIAAMTTSIPEAANTGRNWDYRYCWLRDAFFVVRALNSLAEVETMENYLRYLNNIVSTTRGGHLQPVYGIGQEATLTEREVPGLSGYRGMGPVRDGNQAFEHFQHDVYGNVVLAAAQAFMDKRLLRPGTSAEFDAYELVGERAFQLHNQPDAGMWEFRTKARVHTSSSLMCWAACDRLAKVCAHLGAEERAALWRERAETIRETIEREAWDPEMDSFVDAFGGGDGTIDASLLLMGEVNFIKPTDERFVKTLDAVERTLIQGHHAFRYKTADDFGFPETAFNICTFWYIDALARVGRTEEARETFEAMLACRNSLGLLSEDTDPATHEPWGNYPQTYSLVGIINAAMRLSRRWEEVV